MTGAFTGPTAAVAAAVLAAAALLLAIRPPARTPAARPAPAPRRETEQAWLRRLRVPLCALGFVAGWAFVGGTPGICCGTVVAGVSWHVLGRAESPGVRRRREQLARDLPLGVDLLGGCLEAGGAVGPALRIVADAVPGPLGDELEVLHHRLALGVDPRTVWHELSAHDQLGPLGRALVRAHESGASVSDSVAALADDLRSRSRAEVEQRARSVDVLAAAPLGVCLLPAFMLLGVVPMVAGIFTTMHLFG